METKKCHPFSIQFKALVLYLLIQTVLWEIFRAFHHDFHPFLDYIKSMDYFIWHQRDLEGTFLWLSIKLKIDPDVTNSETKVIRSEWYKQILWSIFGSITLLELQKKLLVWNREKGKYKTWTRKNNWVHQVKLPVNE